MKRLAWVFALLMTACSTDDGGGGRSGRLILTLAGTTGNDGALLVVVSGGPVLSVDAPTPYQVAAETDGAGTHIMVVGSLGSGAIASIEVPDLSRASDYVATVVQMADRSSFGLVDPVRYQVTISP